MNNLIYVLLKQNQDEDALAWPGKIVKIQQENPFFLNNHPLAHFKSGDPARARSGSRHFPSIMNLEPFE